MEAMIHSPPAMNIMVLMELESSCGPANNIFPVYPAIFKPSSVRVLARETPNAPPKLLAVVETLEAMAVFSRGRAIMVSVLLGLVNRPCPTPHKNKDPIIMPKFDIKYP